MSKLMPMVAENGETYGYMFWCPGCQSYHGPHTREIGSCKAVWGFNGDMDKPTFTPSILVNSGKHCPNLPVCHSFVTDGNIQFLGDCTHALAGQTVPLPDLNDEGEPL